MKVRRVIASGVAVILVALLIAASDLVLEEEFLAGAWPWVWGIACACTLVAAMRPASLDCWIAAGVSLQLVSAGRIAALWARVPDQLETAGQEAVSMQRAVLGTAVYVLLIWLIGCLWWLASPRRYQ